MAREPEVAVILTADEGRALQRILDAYERAVTGEDVRETRSAVHDLYMKVTHQLEYSPVKDSYHNVGLDLGWYTSDWRAKDLRTRIEHAHAEIQNRAVLWAREICQAVGGLSGAWVDDRNRAGQQMAVRMFDASLGTRDEVKRGAGIP
jgi:hypothetical protein